MRTASCDAAATCDAATTSLLQPHRIVIPDRIGCNWPQQPQRNRDRGRNLKPRLRLQTISTIIGPHQPATAATQPQRQHNSNLKPYSQSNLNKADWNKLTPSYYYEFKQIKALMNSHLFTYNRDLELELDNSWVYHLLESWEWFLRNQREEWTENYPYAVCVWRVYSKNENDMQRKEQQNA